MAKPKNNKSYLDKRIKSEGIETALKILLKKSNFTKPKKVNKVENKVSTKVPTKINNKVENKIKTKRVYKSKRKYGVNEPTRIKYRKLYQKARNKAQSIYFEQSAKARIISGDSSRVYKPYAFKYKTFNQLLKEGIDIYKGGKKVGNISGLQAVKHRIKQLKKYQSINSKVEHWIKNYLIGLKNIGMPENLISKIRAKFKEIDPNYLSYLITIGNVPDFSFIYDGDDALAKFQEILDIISFYTNDESNQRRYGEIQRQISNKKYIKQEGVNLRRLERATRGKKWKPL